MFGPEGIEAIANILGTELPGQQEDEKNIWEVLDEEKEQRKMKQEAEEEKNTKMLIREGREDDVFKDCRKGTADGRADGLLMNRVGDYTEEEFQRDFVDERTLDEEYEVDFRRIANVEESS